MKRVRLVTLLGLSLLALAPNRAQANFRYHNIPNANILLEHLVRHADELLTEVNLTRANQFLIINPVLVDIRARGGWGWAFYSRLLLDQNGSRIPEYYIGKLVNDFRMEAIQLYDFWWKDRRPTPALTQQFVRTDYTYTNALAAVYFYIEALRRSYVIRGAQGRAWSNQVLLRRLAKLERLAFELREAMLSIRFAALFRFPVRRACLECTYRPYRINVNVNVAQNFIPFPFRHDNQFWNVSDIRPVPADAGVSLLYNTQYWDQRWNYIDQSYINGYQVQPGQPGPGQRPGDQGPAPYTPVLPDNGNGGQVPGYPDVRDPLYQGGQVPVDPYGDPGYGQGQPLPPSSGDVVPQGDYNY